MTANRYSLFNGEKQAGNSLEEANRHRLAADVMPLLLSLVSGRVHLLGHYTDAPDVLEWVNSGDMPRLLMHCHLGTASFLRPDFRPLVLNSAIMHTAASALRKYLASQFEAFHRQYAADSECGKAAGSPPLWVPFPRVILWPGLGIFTFTEDQETTHALTRPVSWQPGGMSWALVR